MGAGAGSVCMLCPLVEWNGVCKFAKGDTELVRVRTRKVPERVELNYFGIRSRAKCIVSLTQYLIKV